jgi:hypothetical protein
MDNDPAVEAAQGGHGTQSLICRKPLQRLGASLSHIE